MIAPPLNHLTLRNLDTGQTRTLSGTGGATYPFWAADGHAIAFFVPGSLKVVDLETGAVQKICDAPSGRGGTWSRDGTIVFAPDYGSALFKVGENGGALSAVTKSNEKTYSHRNPTFLPDGKHFLYCAVPRYSNDMTRTMVRIGSIDGGVDRLLLPYASNVSYVDGWLLSTRDRNLVAQPFDVKTMTLAGKPVALTQNVEWYLGRWLGTFSAGSDTLVYRSVADPKRQLLLLDPKDGVARPTGEAGDFAYPALSPDGRRVVVNRGDRGMQGSDLWMLDTAGGNPVRLTFQAQGTMDDSALFSPDGLRLALVSTDKEGILRAWIQPVGGGAKERLRPDSDHDFVNLGDWSPDGKSILMFPQREGRGRDIEMVRLDGRLEQVPLINGPATEGTPRISPNGRWMAYSSDESGRSEIYVTDFPATNAKWQVSTTGGISPAWSADGGKLYYLADKSVVVAAVHEAGSFSADPARPIQELGDQITGFDVARNGRIVAVRELDSGVPPMTVVLHWQKSLTK
jgi:eukaryotic-like serine/threonine-protein kinase